MMRALHTAVSGMYAQQMYIDTISNNLANVNTTAFKKSDVVFEDLIYQTIQGSGSGSQGSGEVSSELRIGHGVKVVGIEKQHTQGAPTATGNPLDSIIEGEGFFVVRKSSNELAYTRDGNFKRSPDGQMVNAEGMFVEPNLNIPEDTLQVLIGPDGIVSVRVAGSVDLEEIGSFELARFTNPAGLRPIGKNLYEETEASGAPIIGQPGTEGFGELQQGFLESSNVSVVEEMVNMIVAQRAYEVSSKAIKTAEELLQIANNLKR